LDRGDAIEGLNMFSRLRWSNTKGHLPRARHVQRGAQDLYLHSVSTLDASAFEVCSCDCSDLARFASFLIADMMELARALG
jgi:hypothetical protein